MPRTVDPTPLSPRHIARIFGVSIATVANWADSGKLPSFRTPGGQRRFHRADVEAFFAAQRPEPESTEATA